MAGPDVGAGFVPGTILLDRYRILRELGTGGMSRVVCAEHVSLGTKVAMKFLLPDLATLPDAPQRFVREAMAATRVKSEHVAKVLDVGTLPGGPPYMVMEYLEGQDLGRAVRQGKRFDPTEAVDLAVQVADALARAHAAGVIHRDVKPSNLFVTHRPDGTPLVKVLDFGISKVVEEAAKENLDLTKTTVVMGSALYMSLEQMRSTKTVDHRTDIYALGVSLYELLTGTHPFTADSFSELCVKVSLDPPVPLRTHRPDVPQALADVIAVACARNAVDRYQTAGGFAEALLPFASPEATRTIEAIQRFERESYPDGKVPERRQSQPSLPTVDVPRPFKLDWTLYGPLAGAIVVAAAVILATRSWRTGAGTGGTSGTPDAGHDVDTATAPRQDVPDAGNGNGSRSDGGLDGGASQTPAEPDAGAPDAGKGKPLHPCKPGEMVRLPNGLLKPCGL